MRNTTDLQVKKSIVDASSQTPIEIALKIDEHGMTTASNLYTFLELNPTQFSRWCKRNIVNNKFATENIDYICFDISVDSAVKGQTKTDYKITSDFAKKLSMTGNTERHEQARQYFIACEQGLKVAVQKLQNNSDMTPITEAITSMSQTIATLSTSMASMQQDIQDIKQSQRNRYLTEKKYPSAWYKKNSSKFKMLMEYFDCTRSELYSNIFKELEDTYDLDIDQIYEDYCYENHLTKDECYTMDAIEHNTKLREALTLLLDSNLVKYGLQTEDEVKHFKRRTLFDMEPRQIINANIN